MTAARFLRGRPVRVPGTCKAFGCENPVRGRLHYCSEACQIDTDVRCGWGVRGYVGGRDHGVCTLCGCDTRKIRRVADHLQRIQKELMREAQPDQVPGWAEEFAGILRWPHDIERWDRWLLLALGFRRDHQAMWEADHIVPVTERPLNDPPCGLDGYRTLCIPCHVVVTRELRQRMARRQRCWVCGRPRKRSRLTRRPCLCERIAQAMTDRAKD